MDPTPIHLHIDQTEPSLCLQTTHQPTATTTHTRCKCMPNSTRSQIRQTGNKNTEMKNRYNFSQTYPNKGHKRPSCHKHIDKSDKPKRQPQFKRQPNEPITNTRDPSTIPRAPSKQDEIDTKAKHKQKIKSTNENRRITPVLQIHPQTNQKVFQVKYRTNFPPNQKEPTHRNNLMSFNKKATKITNTVDLYKVLNNAFTEIAGDNVLIVKRVDTRRRRLRSRRRRRVTRGEGHLPTSALPTSTPHPNTNLTTTNPPRTRGIKNAN